MKKIKIIVKSVIFIIILLVCVNSIHSIMRNKESYIRKKAFLDQEEPFDVLFFGTSHIDSTVHPMELYKKHGIISYNLGESSELLPGNYWNLKLALKHTKPKLVVLDAYAAYDKSRYYNETRTHITFDMYPFSYTKIQGILDIMGKEKGLDYLVKYCLNLSTYHSRWNELTENDFVPEVKFYKGARMYRTVYKPTDYVNYNEITASGSITTGVKYLKMFINCCKELGIDVLITYMPLPPSDSMVAWSKYIGEICLEENVPYINFLSLDIIDYITDMADDEHLNKSGAFKVTDYIGKYIKENYNIPDQRNNEEYVSWSEEQDAYIDYKISILKKYNKNLNSYLMLLYDDDFEFDIKIRSTVDLNTDSQLVHLLDNLGNKYVVDDTGFNTKDIRITVYDKRDGSQIDKVYFKY